MPAAAGSPSLAPATRNRLLGVGLYASSLPVRGVVTTHTTGAAVGRCAVELAEPLTVQRLTPDELLVYDALADNEAAVHGLRDEAPKKIARKLTLRSSQEHHGRLVAP
jgi:hypothetical protein